MVAFMVCVYYQIHSIHILTLTDSDICADIHTGTYTDDLCDRHTSMYVVSTEPCSYMLHLHRLHAVWAVFAYICLILSTMQGFTAGFPTLTKSS